jgi:hypothetical protein
MRPYYTITNDRYRNSVFYLLFADPHIKVAGRLDDVRSAKEKIMEILDTRVSTYIVIYIIYRVLSIIRYRSPFKMKKSGAFYCSFGLHAKEIIRNVCLKFFCKNLH